MLARNCAKGARERLSGSITVGAEDSETRLLEACVIDGPLQLFTNRNLIEAFARQVPLAVDQMFGVAVQQIPPSIPTRTSAFAGCQEHNWRRPSSGNSFAHATCSPTRMQPKSGFARFCRGAPCCILLPTAISMKSPRTHLRSCSPATIA